MKNIEQKLKQSSFSILTIIVLALTAITVFWFNNIVTTQMPNGSSNTSSTVQQSNGQMQEFDTEVATRLRQLTPSASVTSAPDIAIEGRINPFAE